MPETVSIMCPECIECADCALDAKELDIQECLHFGHANLCPLRLDGPGVPWWGVRYRDGRTELQGAPLNAKASTPQP